MNPNDPPKKPAKKNGSMKIITSFILGIALPVVVLFIGGKAALNLIDTSPKAQRKNSNSRNARLVEVEPACLSKETTLIQAMGTVKPARKIRFQPRVSGEVIEVSPELLPGGVFRAGEMVLRIDPTDYELIVRQRTGEVAHAQSNHQLELGSQSIAQSEYELLGESILEEDRDLVLRKPQLKAVEAALDIARAALEKARLDLDRTRVRAPFNALVQSREVNLGAQVTTATPLATLVGTDHYWVELSLPVNQLKWVRIPRNADHETGSRVRVFNEAAWGAGVWRSGRVIRLAGDLEEEGRMARLIVSVPDPLCLLEENQGAPTLLIDSYVRVEIEGLELGDVVAVRRGLLRDGDRIWILDADNRLEIRPVTVAYRGRERVFVSVGLAAGDRIVTTDLSAPVPGMPLRIREDEVAE